MLHALKVGFWVTLFAVATFFWVALFEHGLAGFGEGLKAEFAGLRALFGSG